MCSPGPLVGVLLLVPARSFSSCIAYGGLLFALSVLDHLLHPALDGLSRRAVITGKQHCENFGIRIFAKLVRFPIDPGEIEVRGRSSNFQRLDSVGRGLKKHRAEDEK